MKYSTFVILTILFCLLTSTAWASPDYCRSKSAAKEDLKQSLLARYGNSFSTVKMLLDSGVESYERLCSVPDDGVRQGIISKLNGRYYPAFSTIWMLYESNYKDYQALQ
ncbi:MAG: hypothetical protein L3J63_04215 [Geopsychrobacter sp.]|nr:hypothetical protein [Geopsychrobacter sp.]